jgi:hypothetical protein
MAIGQRYHVCSAVVADWIVGVGFRTVHFSTGEADSRRALKNFVFLPTQKEFVVDTSGRRAVPFGAMSTP